MEDKIINISLSVKEWNSILSIVAVRPYAEVHEIILKIQSQATNQINKNEDLTLDSE